MKVLVCGSRTWVRADVIQRRLRRLPLDTTIMHGGARGADRIAAEQARQLGFRVVEYPADWETHGKAAGAIRNREMLDQKPGLVLAFSLNDSPGTRDCITEARKREIPVEVFTR